MRTIKVLGSGPLAGQVFYGALSFDVLVDYNSEVCLKLDHHFYERNNYKCFNAVFDLESNALMFYGYSDLLRIDPQDIPKVYEMIWEAEQPENQHKQQAA